MRLDRRRFLLGGVALAAAAGAAIPAWARQAGAGPTARVEPVSEDFFGQTVVDPYRWMENPTDPDWSPYLRANAEHARAAFDALAGRDRLQARMTALNRAYPLAWAPDQAAGKLFFRRQAPDAEQPMIFVREDGEDRLLVDPVRLGVPGAGPVTLNWWLVSPDGRFVVFGLAQGGTEDAVLHLMDVASGELLPERIDRCGYATVGWLPDSSGFFYTRLSGAPFGSMDYFIDAVSWLHRIGTDPAEDAPIMARGLHEAVELLPHNLPLVFCDPSSAWIIGTTDSTGQAPIWKARLADALAGRPDWSLVCGPADGIFTFDFRGADLWLAAVTEEGGTRLLHTDLSAQGPPSGEILMEETEREILFPMATARSLYVAVMQDGYSRLLRLEKSGAQTDIPLPFEGSIIGQTRSSRSGTCYLRLTGWLEPPSVWRVDPDGSIHYADLAPRPDVDTSAYEVIRDVVVARDGERIPLSIIAPRNLRRDGSAPAMVEVYGAYQTSLTPGFDALGLALLERGGVQAIAHVRGGGERGYNWWRAGHLENKPNTWRDLIDCGDHLVREGWTSPDRLGVTGGSAGGVAVGRALTERPDLFGLVVADVGLMNPLRGEFEPSGPGNIPEFGSVSTLEGFRALHAMDSLHHVVDGRRYPAVVLTHGVNDPRVAPWHSAKMAARLRAAGSPDSGVVLFHVDFDAGHGIITREQGVRRRADIYALLLDLAGRA